LTGRISIFEKPPELCEAKMNPGGAGYAVVAEVDVVKQGRGLPALLGELQFVNIVVRRGEFVFAPLFPCMAGSGFLCFGTVKIRKAVITAAGRDQRRPATYQLAS
jgi:hypothetical protein